ncbi:cytochrome C [Azospirillum sp. RWY-5-1]|uniref:Cytochrome C n=1 Tax=Azospirillum oleiclasticum TaxID=2735135 RepID=A0ABX2T9Q2_9PROT|nr:c-type cytochrome [Azospirillum oleiclasticum]NYZ13790.1 cytochrome C [Azospirillum oleiclasticum]NYZ21062.1 cytochrome C [Azospirillum oleiclasticum]
MTGSARSLALWAGVSVLAAADPGAAAGPPPGATAGAPPGAVSCAGCHAPAAVGGPVPDLTGRPAVEIVAAMQAFRGGTRPATVMDRIAKGFSDEETRAIADWLSAPGGGEARRAGP